MSTQLHAGGFAAENVAVGCTASVLVLSGVKPERKLMITFVKNVISNYVRPCGQNIECLLPLSRVFPATVAAASCVRH